MNAHPLRRAWPLPAVLAWVAAWALAHAGVRAGLPAMAATLLALLPAALLAWVQAGWVRPAVLMVGSALVLALTSPVAAAPAAVPGWVWLAAAGLLALLYPLRAWRDAPLFPTPAQALQGLAAAAPVPPGARVLDAGCGLGHGLRALRRAYPQAQLEGVEWSPALALLCRLRCPWARVRRADLWATDWRGLAVVYLFQRPETMPRAWAKALADMSPGAWLVSLAFEVPGVAPAAAWPLPGGRQVWVYRVPVPGVSGPSSVETAGKTTASEGLADGVGGR